MNILLYFTAWAIFVLQTQNFLPLSYPSVIVYSTHAGLSKLSLTEFFAGHHPRDTGHHPAVMITDFLIFDERGKKQQPTASCKSQYTCLSLWK